MVHSKLSTVSIGHQSEKPVVPETFQRMISLLQAADVTHSMRSPFITSGYRPALSLTSCAKSILALHNETINIWTHLLGFCYFFWLFCDNLRNYQDHTTSSFDLISVLIQLLTYQVGVTFISIRSLTDRHLGDRLLICHI